MVFGTEFCLRAHEVPGVGSTSVAALIFYPRSLGCSKCAQARETFAQSSDLSLGLTPDVLFDEREWSSGAQCRPYCNAPRVVYRNRLLDKGTDCAGPIHVDLWTNLARENATKSMGDRYLRTQHVRLPRMATCYLFVSRRGALVMG